MNGSPNRFTLLQESGRARRGSYRTAHGTFETPNFMPVGTKASVKGIDCERLAECGAQITLVNTYHLWLRPGHGLIEALGGVHRFSGWKGPILSDSGGFQIFSLQKIRKLNEEGVEFRSHIDGSKQFLSPELSIKIQESLGVDIAMALDECPAGTLDYKAIDDSLSMTLRWARRSLEARTRPETSLFGITQGACFKELRTRSAEEIARIPFDGYAIGGLSVGEPKESMYDVLSYHPEQLPHDRIRYLMGVGTPEDLVEGVHKGVDLFDCVMPTRSGRFGRVFVGGIEPYLNLRNARFGSDPTPLDPDCRCVACRNYSRAYLHHLFRNDEMLGPQLASIHNVTHYLTLMKKMRDAITEGTFEALYQAEKRRWLGASIGPSLQAA